MKNKTKYIIFIGIALFLYLGYSIVDNLLFTGIQPKHINQDGFQANFFAPENAQNQTAIVLLGGGQWGDYWAQEFAKKQMVGLSLPYIGNAGLPTLPEDIELKYFEKAIDWLKVQAEVNPNKIIVMGASRNAELALIVASTYSNSIRGVIAYAPSPVSWSNTVLPYNSDELKASWTYEGQDIPYVPMDKIKGNDSNKITMLEYWTSGLAKIDYVRQAAIQVEKINGPILLFSGNDDQVWPSSHMADMIEDRLAKNNFKNSIQNIQYDNAGHAISSNPDDQSNFRSGRIMISGKEYEYQLGGTAQGDYLAKQDARTKLFEYLEKI